MHKSLLITGGGSGLGRAAAELGDRNIRVNCVIPGGVFSEINQRAGLFDDHTTRRRLDDLVAQQALAQYGKPSDIAEAMDYLINADWTAGAILDVDGGLGLGVTPDTRLRAEP